MGFDGRVHSVETKRRMTKAAKLRWSRPSNQSELKRRMKSTVYRLYRQKMSRLMYRRWAGPKFKLQMIRTHKESGHYPQPSLGARKLKRLLGRGWKLEHWVWKGIAIDIAHPKLKLAIEVDGKSHGKEIQKKQDRQRDKVLRKLGWTVFRVSEDGCRLLGGLRWQS
jgi:hypothetical protein